MGMDSMRARPFPSLPARRSTATMFSLIWLAMLVSTTSGSFVIWDGYAGEQFMLSQPNLTTSCVAALNATINCDETTMSRAAGGVDLYYWGTENLTTLCTNECQSSLDDWMQQVEGACSNQAIVFMGTIMQAITMPVVWQYGYSTACLQDSQANWCMYASQNWTGTSYISYDPMMCANQNPADNPPQCNDPTFDPATSARTADMVDVRNLYPQDLLCDECFILMWKQRLETPFLQSGDGPGYLIEQYDNIQQNCSVSLPLTTASSTQYIVPTTTADPTSTSSTMTSVATTSTPATTANCLGQVIPPNSGGFCQNITAAYGLATGDLVAATGDAVLCSSDQPLCLPLPCEGIIITKTQTCAEWVASISNSTNNVTTAMFLNWNPNILGNCRGLPIGQRVCTSPPGGAYVPSGVIYAPSAASEYYATATANEPTQSGSVAACGAYYDVVAGDTCNEIALRYGINFTQLQQLNSYLNSDCTNLWLNYAVCVAPVTQPPLSTNGSCGATYSHATCTGTSFGSCCSISGTCGDGDGYCDVAHCASGACDTVATTDGTCGPSHGGTTCTNPEFGPCCSTSGYCGNSTDYCGAGNCYSGACQTDEGGPSSDGSCGPNFAGNKTCAGTQFGSCCSTSGYCGSTEAYCGVGNCYSGACDSSGSSNAISTNGTCGASQPGNMTCAGSSYGDCCGAFSTCGSGDYYCAFKYGCQDAYSRGCYVNAPSTNGTCGASQPGNFTCAGTDFGDCCGAFNKCGNGTYYCSSSYGCQPAYSTECT